MIPVRCPLCGKAFAIERLDELPSFPFCTDRCKLIDLGRWIDGAYAIPAASRPESPDESRPDEQEESED